MFTENDGVIVANRSRQQPFCISGVRRRYDLDTGNRSEQRIKNLRMLRTRSGAGTDHCSDHHGRSCLTAKHVTKLRYLIQYLVEADAKKVDKHELCYRTQPCQRRATCRTHNGRLGNRGVDNTPHAIFLRQPLSNPINATLITGNVLSHDNDPIISGHFLMQRLINGLTDRHLH